MVGMPTNDFGITLRDKTCSVTSVFRYISPHNIFDYHLKRCGAPKYSINKIMKMFFFTQSNEDSLVPT